MYGARRFGPAHRQRRRGRTERVACVRPSRFYTEEAVLVQQADCARLLRAVVRLRNVNFSLYLKDADTMLERDRAQVGRIGYGDGPCALRCVRPRLRSPPTSLWWCGAPVLRAGPSACRPCRR